MRILITSIVDLRRVAHNRIHVFAEYLSRRHDVAVLCLNARWLDSSEGGQAGADYHRDPYFQAMFDRTRILYLSDGRRPPVLQELASLRNLDALLLQIDLPSFDAHINYSNLIAGYAVGRRASRLGIPTLLDIADDLPHSFARSPQVPPLLRPVAGVVARGMLTANIGLADRVTFVTQALQEAYHLPADRVLVPNGFHGELHAQRSTKILKRQLGMQRSFVLGFVGTLLEWVDLEPAFRALKTLCREDTDVRMLVVGGGARLQQNIQLAAACGVSDKVAFTGHVALSTVPDYISCMDVCLVCRKTSADSDRSLPVKLFEYMACGKPVISVPLAGVKEAVGDRVLYARDSQEFASSIQQLYQDDDLRRRMGQEGKNLVRTRYDWEHICRRFEAILLEAAGESKGRTRRSAGQD